MDTLQAAQLQVALPGTRASFRRRVIDAMRGLVAAPGGFCFFGKDDARAYADSTRLVDGANRPVQSAPGLRLSDAFGFDPKSVVQGSRRAFVSTELWPAAELAQLPYFRDHSMPDGFVRALLLFLHEGGVLFGLAGVERRADAEPFDDDDKHAFELLAPFVVAGARTHLQYDELAREASALRALGHINGAVYVIDRESKRAVFAADRDRGVDWEEDVLPIEEQLVSAAERLLAARSRGDALPTPPTLPSGTVVAVAKIDGDPVFGGGRCAAIRVQAPDRASGLEGLSKRERDIARLLIAGYSGVNVAAISGLSENTVRTYVRRLYAKLGVNNRADLVRRLVSPEPNSSTPSSPLGPPPDSSLVAGDDTLD